MNDVLYNSTNTFTADNSFSRCLALIDRFLTKLFSKSNIFDSIWGGEDSLDENTVKVHISNFRAKLKKYDNEEYIETVWGMGYRLL